MRRLPVTMMSDFVCPWCFIGERRLFRAIESLPAELQVDLSYRPFELNPDMPAGGISRREYRVAKFGSWARSQAMDAQVAATGQADGIAFNYDCVMRTPNTLPAHRLMWLAARAGSDQRLLADRLFTAYFTDGLDLSDKAVLRGIAAGAGLPGDRADAVLDGPEGEREVRALVADAYRRGIQGVPLFEIGGMAISGAQSVAVIADALRGAASLPTAA